VKHRVLALTASLLLLVAHDGAAQTAEPTAKVWTIGLAAGVRFPVGQWSEHPYAFGVRQFGTAWAASGELAYHTSDRFSIALVGGYGPLETGDWERYAAAHGDAVEATAWLGTIGLALRPCIWADPLNAVGLEFSGGILFSGGRESYGRHSYDYTFLPELAVMLGGGLEYERRLSDPVAVYARASFQISLADPAYGDGSGSMLQSIPLVAGIRLRL
jgi:hypothetical protein